MKESGRREGRLTSCSPHLSEEAGSHLGLLTCSPPEILQTTSPRAVFIQDNIINVGGWKQRCRESQAGNGLGKFRGQTWPWDTPTTVPHLLSYSTPASHHMSSGVGPGAGEHVSSPPHNHLLSTAWAPRPHTHACTNYILVYDTDMYNLPRVRHPRLPIPAPM